MESFREHQTANQARGPKKRTGTSKYDFFKVKVWLGENMDHYYIMSRFLICRMLTVTKIPYIKAVKIALETKKYLVDNNLTDITQGQLEDVLFSIIRSKGFDEQYIDCYRLVTQFYQSRQPLCIVICGTAWTGKSTIAQQLASRINIPNVMQTDVIYELLRAGPDSPLARQPLWCRPGIVDRGLVGEFRREARVVRKGMEGDLIKTLSDGKPIIIEGMHLDPGLYIHDFGQRGIIMLPARPTTAMQLARSPRPAAAPESASRPPYKRSLTAMACSRAGAVSAVSASAAEADDDCTAADGRQFGRCVSADAELPVLVAPASAPIGSHAGRPRSAGVSGMRGATLAAGEELSAGAEVAADPPAAAVEGTQAADELDQMLQGSGQALLQQQVSGVEQRCNGTMLLQHHQKGTCEPAVGNYAGSDTNQCTVVECLPAALAAAQQPEVVSQTRGVLASSSSSTFMHLVSSTGSSSDNIVHTYEEMSTYRAAAADVAQLSLAESNQAASAAALSWPLCASSSGQLTAAPTVIMLDQLHVCAATAEAVALQQQALQLEQQPRLSVSIVSPGSPLSDSTALADPSPCISQEHSTTDVVSRQPSFNSPSPTLLSQEPSASDVGLGLGCSPAAVHLQQAAANAASAEGEPCSSVSCSVSALNLQGSLQPEQQQQQHEVVPLVEGPSNGLHAVLEVEQSQKQPASQQQDQQQGLPEDAAVAASTGNTSANASLVAHASVQKLVSSSSAEGSGAHPTQPETSIQAMTGITEQQQQPVSPAAEQQQFEPRADARDAAAAHSENAEVYASAGPVADGAGQKGQLHSDSSKRVGQQQLDRKGHAQKPLFVPVLVYMDEADHALMQEQASPHMGLSMGRSNAADAGAASSQVGHGSAGSRASKGAQETSSRVAAAGAVDGSDESLEAPGTVQAAAAVGSQEALRRMRLLQEYLCAYEAQGLPVVKVSYGNFSEALDKLHEYILQCIKVAMQL